ncbi:MAG: hypothetical protein H0V20_05790 [Actinobacteria bacterium]|nr:hypothetical protein [Actinomycetota bacterium]
MNVLALSWIDEFLELETSYRSLWRSYTALQSEYLHLLLELENARQLRDFSVTEIDRRFPLEGRAA